MSTTSMYATPKTNYPPITHHINNNFMSLDTLNQSDLTIKPPITPKTPSNYTSDGRCKCAAAEPIRSEEHIQQILEYFLSINNSLFVSRRNYTLFILGSSIGIRACDLLRIKIRDVFNFSKRTIVDSLPIFESKTNKMNHPYLNQRVKTVLSAYISYLSTISEIKDDNPLFPSSKDFTAEMTTNNLNKIMRKVQKDLDLPYNLGIHSLRKTFAYWTIKLHPNDTNALIALMQMLNHSSLQATYHYAGIEREQIQPMYDDLAEIFTHSF